MKDRLRKTVGHPKSPDLADGVLLTFAPAVDDSAIVIVPVSVDRESSPWSHT